MSARRRNQITQIRAKGSTDRSRGWRRLPAFAIGSVILLVLTIVALQAYFEQIWNEAVYEKVLAPPSEQLSELRKREDWNLTHYGYHG